jgi:Na+/proline symporter
VGGTKIVSLTQRYQILVILIGMALAFGIAVYRLPADLSFTNALSLAGKMGKLQAVDFSIDPSRRYTFWSGILGGFFLSLSYFGADQSQVQRYLAGGSLRASRVGLLFNAIVKVPMQFLILLLGAMIFLFYQFEKPPMFFNQPTYQRAIENGYGPQLTALQTRFDEVFTRKRDTIQAMSNASAENTSALTAQVREFDAEARTIRDDSRKILEQAGASPKSKDSDYIFITFVIDHLPHGVVGLLVAVILCATMSATSAVLNALGSTTAVDLYRPLIRPKATDHHYVVATKVLTAAWGLVAIAVASFASLVENLIEAGNILASVFYGSILGLFLVAFFMRNVRGSAVFFAAVIAQILVLALFFTTSIGYLWYNVIGCALVLLFAWILQQTVFRNDQPATIP